MGGVHLQKESQYQQNTSKAVISLKVTNNKGHTQKWWWCSNCNIMDGHPDANCKSRKHPSQNKSDGDEVELWAQAATVQFTEVDSESEQEDNNLNNTLGSYSDANDQEEWKAEQEETERFKHNKTIWKQINQSFTSYCSSSRTSNLKNLSNKTFNFLCKWLFWLHMRKRSNPSLNHNLMLCTFISQVRILNAHNKILFPLIHFKVKWKVLQLFPFKEMIQFMSLNLTISFLQINAKAAKMVNHSHILVKIINKKSISSPFLSTANPRRFG